VLFEVPGVVVPLVGLVLQGTLLPGDAVDPGVVEHGGVEDGTPGVVPGAPGIVDCGVAVSLVLPGGVVVCCSGRVPGAIVPDVPELGLLVVVLPGMVPVGLEGVVAAGGCVDPVAPVAPLVAVPVCAAHASTSAALQAAPRIIVEMSFINVLLIRRALPAEIAFDQNLLKARTFEIAIATKPRVIQASN
jgi:hypothetical protein